MINKRKTGRAFRRFQTNKLKRQANEAIRIRNNRFSKWDYRRTFSSGEYFGTFYDWVKIPYGEYLKEQEEIEKWNSNLTNYFNKKYCYKRGVRHAKSEGVWWTYYKERITDIEELRKRTKDREINDISRDKVRYYVHECRCGKVYYKHDTYWFHNDRRDDYHYTSVVKTRRQRLAEMHYEELDYMYFDWMGNEDETIPFHVSPDVYPGLRFVIGDCGF